MYGKLLLIGLSAAAWIGLTFKPAVNAQEGPAAVEAEAEVLMRGPIHEAFAAPLTFDPKPTIIVQKRVPAPIEELPPDQKPAGDNVAWLPGYWAWEEDRGAFIWVSGFWRVLPPGRQWVPGYWYEVAAGSQWVPGFWAPADLRQIDYYPVPPPTLEAGPSIPAPSPDHIWVSGCWVWQDHRFVWRPGYWVMMHPDWTWIPAYHVWTPRGCVYVDGYWDYSLSRRGLLFAPVYLDVALYSQPRYYFTPRIVLIAERLVDHLFCRSIYHHYYFGDYYAASYLQAGYYPWFVFHQDRHGYDPIYAYYGGVRVRSDPAWTTRVRQEYRTRVDVETARPPRTYAKLQGAVQGMPAGSAKEALSLAAPLEQMKSAALQLEQVGPERRTEIGKQSKESYKVAGQRIKAEAAPGAAKASEGRPQTAPLTSSPFKGKPAKGGKAPPAIPTPPKPDLKAVPRPGPAQPAQPPAPKGEPAPSPKDSPKPADKAEPTKPPKSEPKPAPSPKDKDDKKGKDKDSPTKGKGKGKDKPPKDETKPKDKSPKD